MVSTTMASDTELAGRLRAVVTFRLVVVTLVIVVLPRLDVSEIYKLVEVAEVATKLEKKALVEVTDVPVAVVKPKAPERVPPVRSK